jgi:hypothetical protein
MLELMRPDLVGGADVLSRNSKSLGVSTRALKSAVGFDFQIETRATIPCSTKAYIGIPFRRAVRYSRFVTDCDSGASKTPRSEVSATVCWYATRMLQPPQASPVDLSDVSNR